MRNFLIPDYSRTGPGIDRNAPKKTGIPLFIETFCREFTTLLKLNFIFFYFILIIKNIIVIIEVYFCIWTAVEDNSL